MRTTADDYGYIKSNPPGPPSAPLQLPGGTFVSPGMNGGVSAALLIALNPIAEYEERTWVLRADAEQLAGKDS
jgi:hypothetical protein